MSLKIDRGVKLAALALVRDQLTQLHQVAALLGLIGLALHLSESRRLVLREMGEAPSSAPPDA